MSTIQKYILWHIVAFILFAVGAVGTFYVIEVQNRDSAVDGLE